MNTNNLQQKIRNIGLVLSLVFSFVLLSSVDAKAQYQDPNYYPQSRRNDDHHKKNKHKHDKRGNGNYNRGNRDDDRDGDYDDDDRDDNNGRGDRNRNNNDNGYYDRNGNYHPNNNNGNYGNNDGYYGNNRNSNNIYRIAQQNGYNDGLRKGAEDARENHSNPQGTSEYKRATNGYSSSYGNKEQYKQAYRQAFLQGFDEGQNQGYNNRNGRRRTNSAGSIFRQIIRGY